MPPHCDTMDGPVVTAARHAIEKEDVALILPFVKEEASVALTSAFEKTLRARKAGAAAREVADLYFFETAVRLHTSGTSWRGSVLGSWRVHWRRMASPRNVSPDSHALRDERHPSGRPGERAQGRLRNLTTMRERAC